ncbi:MAG TPA: TfpX/TfpZ family type IV pilin accessory protein [Ramlibacter sp.]|nr:TfpX/TfpZ family type IV pilin accessory protein [Ramlibacter sp.]
MVSNWNERLQASALHLGISIVVAAMAAALVFAVWYPYPYREISGGRELFLILVGVDVVMGPLITLSVFDRAKPRAELRRDLTIVGLLQLAALAYGMWSVAVARPVHLVFEIDRFRVVHGVDVPESLMGRWPDNVEAMPWAGPTLLATRPFRNPDEKMEATLAALKGVQIGARPDFWMGYDEARPRVLRVARPLADLRSRFPNRASDIDAAAKSVGRAVDALSYVPMVGRKFFWTVLVDRNTADVVGFIPVDPY